MSLSLGLGFSAIIQQFSERATSPPGREILLIPRPAWFSLELVSEIFANQFHMNAILDHMSFNNAPHIAYALSSFAIEA
jgi:hypothetical protein